MISMVVAVLQRGGDVDITSGAQAVATNQTATYAGLLVNQAKRKLQLDPRYDWTCQEDHLVAPYSLNGIPIDDTVRRVRAVYVADTDAVTGQPRRGRELAGSNRDAQEARELSEQHHRHQQFGAHGRRHHHHDKAWWLEERRLWTNEHHLAGTNLWLDIYAILPDYQDVADEDWFSTHAPEALVYKAASLGAAFGWESARSEFWRVLAEGDGSPERRGLIYEAWADDQRFSDGATADIARPRLRGVGPHLFT